MVFIIAISPVFLIILSGYICRYYSFPGDQFWPGAEKITYFILFPSLLLSKMATADLSTVEFIKPLSAVLLLYCLITVVALVCKPFLLFSNAQFTSIYQGSIRFNTYIGLSVVTALYSTSGLVTALILVTLMIPVINLFCILILEYYRQQPGQPILWRVIKSVIANPLIVACVLGLSINLAQIEVASVIMQALDIFSRAALPLGLLTVGAALQFNALKPAIKPLAIASLFKFILLPILALLVCKLLLISGDMQQILLVLALLPTAPASYVLAKQLGGDHQLMATIITGQTLLAVLCMPLMLNLLS